MATVIWSINDLIEIARSRQKNQFDCNIVFSGARGNGKSTGLYKFFIRFKKFRPKKHIVYSRKEVMRLLESQMFGFIFDDEAIRSGYKRNFQDSDQKKLIEMLNMYRDNFNIYGMALPSFYSLDKDLRSLIKIHIHVIKRGLGVVHIAKEGNLYSEDPWDVKFNKRLEENWTKKKSKNPNFSPPYHKLSTFAGYLRYGDLTKKQREFYNDIKRTKRKILYDQENNDPDKSIDMPDTTKSVLYDRLARKAMEHELTYEELHNICDVTGIKYMASVTTLNRRLTQLKAPHRLSFYLKKSALKRSEKGSKLYDDKISTKLPIVGLNS